MVLARGGRATIAGFSTDTGDLPARPPTTKRSDEHADSSHAAPHRHRSEITAARCLIHILSYVYGHVSSIEEQVGAALKFPNGQSQDGRIIRVPVTVLMSCYEHDLPQPFRESIASIERQTHVPSQLVLVVDGPVGDELEHEIRGLSNLSDIEVAVVRLAQRGGLAAALNHGIRQCRYDLVARMDSDDISHPQRIELQFEFLQANPKVALVGGSYDQYDETMSHFLTSRHVPTTHDKIVKYGRTRTPINHVTIMFWRSAVESVGGYVEDGMRFEDWRLAMDLAKNGHILHNLPDVLVDVRGSDAFFDRRGGLRYVRDEYSFLTSMANDGLIPWWSVFVGLAIRAPIRLLPTHLRRLAYGLVRRV